MKNQLVRFLQDEEGSTAIEYGLIAGLIAVGIVAALISVSGGLQGLFTSIASALALSGSAS
ncbi:MAG TPA: Flp family type IVb pilin [Herbaspirillum sp.]|nr:Flp family type IVb pilin [Herbaspirillum sp.]